MDGTPASGYQVLRRESSGGYAQLKDYVLNPVVRFLDSQWEVYTFDDARPSGFSPPSYVGRGVVAGAVTPHLPAHQRRRADEREHPGAEIHGLSGLPRDSNITMSWQAVPGAVGLLDPDLPVQGRQRGQLLAAAPAPLISSNVRNFFVGYVAAPATRRTSSASSPGRTCSRGGRC